MEAFGFGGRSSDVEIFELHDAVHRVGLLRKSNSVLCHDGHGEFLILDGMDRGVHADQRRWTKKTFLVTIRLLCHGSVEASNMGHRRGRDVPGTRTWELSCAAANCIGCVLVYRAVLLAFTLSLLRIRGQRHTATKYTQY